MFGLIRLRGFTVSLGTAVCLGILGDAETVSAVELIVHPGVSNTQVSRNQARAIFSARLSRWEDGKTIKVFVLPEESSLHQDLAKQLLDLYPYQLREAWMRAIYTGMGQAPILVTSEAEMRRLVSETPGAVGYVSKVQSNDKLRALPIR